MSIEEWQVALREEAARGEQFQITHLDENRLWGDYEVSHDLSSYKIAFRGVLSDRNYCSCLDFRTNGLGTCKHIEAVVLKLRQEVPGYPWGERVYTPTYSSIYVSYKGGRTVRFSAGVGEREAFKELERRYFLEDGVLPREHYPLIDEICASALAISPHFRCYEDVYEFIDSELAELRWREAVEEAFPLGRMTTSYALTSQSQEILEELYTMLLRGYGIVVSEATNALRKQVLAMIDFTLRYEEGPALIIAGNHQTEEQWKKLLHRSPLGGSERVFLLSQEHFRISTRLPSGLFSFVYIEEADCLKDWNNIISKTIKKLSIKHLYMHLPTLSRLTPVQFSSISQHISPFLLAPFHRFIRDFRPAFPLSDTGENLPGISKEFVFTRNATRHLLWQDAQEEESLLSSKAELVEQFLRLSQKILADEEACQLLSTRLKRILQ